MFFAGVESPLLRVFLGHLAARRYFEHLYPPFDHRGALMEQIIRKANIEKHFGSVIALSEVTIGFFLDECHWLLGDSGPGKSIPIKTMSVVHKTTKGEISSEGKSMHFEDPRGSIDAGITTAYQDLAVILPNVGESQFLSGQCVGNNHRRDAVL